MAAHLVDAGYGLRRQAADALWTGGGADAFRSRIDGRVRQFEQVGRSIGHAAHEVRAHAEAIRAEERTFEGFAAGLGGGLIDFARVVL